ncbi:MAG: hypothetical protein HOI96_12080 [Rhodospirillaceae bacterium]|nr:hypothetical protein [Rhodospirillaceae bacterium]
MNATMTSEQPRNASHVRQTLIGIGITVAIFAAAIGGAAAGTLENMERERAILLETILSGDMNAAERESRIQVAKTRLVDLERMVLRDKKLIGRNPPAVRAAFDNYDLTFLVHASTEKSRSIADHWLGEVGVSTTALMNARMGRR